VIPPSVREVQIPNIEITGSRAKITVIIAAYNAAAFLPRAVRSAFEQSHPPAEVIIVDDASTDCTLQIAQGLAADERRLRVIALTTNGGPAKARNVALDAATGDWVAVLDADDAYLPNRLEHLESVAAAHAADMVADNFYWYDPAAGMAGEPGIPASHAIEIVDTVRFARNARPYGETADWGLLKPMFRRRFLDAHSLRYPEASRHGEDFLFDMALLMAGGRFVVSYNPGYLYTIRSAGLSRTQVNYDIMIRHSRDLLEDTRVRSDAKLAAAMNARVAALMRLTAEHKIRASRDARSYAALLVDFLKNPEIGIALLRLGRQKFRSWTR
jgi:succinoglycan biosynthesis protein ExoO